MHSLDDIAVCVHAPQISFWKHAFPQNKFYKITFFAKSLSIEANRIVTHQFATTRLMPVLDRLSVHGYISEVQFMIFVCYL